MTNLMTAENWIDPGTSVHSSKEQTPLKSGLRGNAAQLWFFSEERFTTSGKASAWIFLKVAETQGQRMKTQTCQSGVRGNEPRLLNN